LKEYQEKQKVRSTLLKNQQKSTSKAESAVLIWGTIEGTTYRFLGRKKYTSSAEGTKNTINRND